MRRFAYLLGALDYNLILFTVLFLTDFRSETAALVALVLIFFSVISLLAALLSDVAALSPLLTKRLRAWSAACLLLKPAIEFSKKM